MNHNILALLLTAIAGSAHATADAFSDSIPAKAEGVPLAYIGKDTRAATARALCMDFRFSISELPCAMRGWQASASTAIPSPRYWVNLSSRRC